MDLDERLREGPLRVRSVGSSEPPERVARRLLHRRRFLFAVDVALVAAFVVVASLSSLRGAAGGARVAVAGGAAFFADGSRADLAGGGSSLAVTEDTPSRVVVGLTGGARFHVVPDRARTFEVRARDVRVSVLGTTFAVQEVPSGQTHVLVEHGRVAVAWLGGSTVLESGQGGAFPPSPAPEAALLTSAPPVAEAPTPLVDPDPPPSSGAHVAAGARRGWRDYALRGDYGRAFEELHDAGRGREAVRDEAADLILAADVARLSAHPEQAVSPLRRVCERHPTDRRAPVAAFTLGRVLLDDLARPAEAAAAFQRARRLWPEGPLAEDSLARESDAWRKAGDLVRARAVAADYVARYPRGRHAARIRETLTE